MGGGHVRVQVSVPSREEGLRIARSVIEARLAACAQVVSPITSIYRWKGSINVDEEYLLLMKTSADRYDDLEAHVHHGHSYSVAEIISTPINGGLAPIWRGWTRRQQRLPGSSGALTQIPFPRAGARERRTELGQPVQGVSGLARVDRFQGSLAGLDSLVDIANGDQRQTDAGQYSSSLLLGWVAGRRRQVADIPVDAGFVSKSGGDGEAHVRQIG